MYSMESFQASELALALNSIVKKIPASAHILKIQMLRTWFYKEYTTPKPITSTIDVAMYFYCDKYLTKEGSSFPSYGSISKAITATQIILIKKLQQDYTGKKK